MIQFIKEIVRQAGEICLKESQTLSDADLDFKGIRDLATVVDQKVEDFLIGKITRSFPSHDIIGEETGIIDMGSEHRWIIDPIDGTTSYFHRQPFYSVSVAYESAGVTQAGAVYAPALQQLFFAERGEGAYLNEAERLTVSQTDELINTVLATGFACLRAGRKVNNLVHLNAVLPRIRDMRRCGSAALDLAYVASGKVDGFWEMDLNLYDIAAGVLLVQEAGGEVSDMLGGQNFPDDGIVASNGRVSAELLRILAKSKAKGLA